MTAQAPYRFGVLDGEEPGPYAHPGVWEREPTTGPDRLVVAPKGDIMGLITELVTSMDGPYGLLHVLLASRCGRASGRYQSRDPMDEAELRGFLTSFAGYLEHDGRHHTWFFGLGDEQQIIYDNHNLIYCYGDLDRFIELAEARGLGEGVAKIPAPHVHMYNEEFDADEDRLFETYEWMHVPLQPGDDP